MFRHLLVPLDGSAEAQAILPATVELARRAGARITLLHVLEANPPSEGADQRHLRRADEAEDYLRQMASTVPNDLAADWHVHDRTIRHLPQSLVEHVEELGADLVVLRWRRVHRSRDLLFGNVAQQVVSRGTTPALLMRPGTAPDATLPFTRILVPLDWQPDHAVGIGPAKALANLTKASLHLLTVVPTADSLSPAHALTGQLLPGSTRALLEMAENEEAESLAQLVSGLRSEGFSATGYVARGDPYERISDFFQAEGIDTVALGTHGRAGTRAFWSGSLAHRLVRALPASFLLTPVSSAAGDPT
jgi:nucleotide-binding universal stress UspA family protein